MDGSELCDLGYGLANVESKANELYLLRLKTSVVWLLYQHLLTVDIMHPLSLVKVKDSCFLCNSKLCEFSLRGTSRCVLLPQGRQGADNWTDR